MAVNCSVPAVSRISRITCRPYKLMLAESKVSKASAQVTDIDFDSFAVRVLDRGIIRLYPGPS